MDQNQSLHNILLNVLLEVTSPRSDRLQPHQMVGILSLTNLLGIVNYMNHYAPVSDYSPVRSTGSSSSGGDILSSLLQLIGSKTGGGNMPDINPQQLMMLLNLLSTMGQKGKANQESDDNLREVEY